MARFRVRPAASPLRGRARVPGDKSIGHRAVLFAALGRGRSVVRGLSGGEDNRATLAAMRAMGVSADERDDALVVTGVGLRGLRMPRDVVDCGNSGTTMRLLAGLLSGQRFGTRLVGDASLMKRPMGRVVAPLRARGAHIGGTSPEGRPVTEGEMTAPLSIAPLVEGEHLLGLEYDMPIASAQVKSCLLLSGLYAAGPTSIREPTLSRDHTERMMLALGVPLQTAGSVVHLDPLPPDFGWDGADWEVPGDISSAAFPLVAAASIPGSDIELEGVGVNPTRTGLLDMLRQMGAHAEHLPQPEAAGGEPRADLMLRHVPTRGALLGGEMLVRMIDEVPALCALAAASKGVTEVRDARELRVKETDRIAAMAEVLDAFGVPCETLDDGMRITGVEGPLRAARVRSHGDHRIAMSAACLALRAESECIIDDVECVRTSFPSFADTMRALGADIEAEGDEA